MPSEATILTNSVLSCVPAYSSYSVEEFLGAEEKAILYSRGLLQGSILCATTGTTFNNWPPKWYEELHGKLPTRSDPASLKSETKRSWNGLLKNATALALLNFDHNRSYLRNLIRTQQFPSRLSSTRWPSIRRASTCTLSCCRYFFLGGPVAKTLKISPYIKSGYRLLSLFFIFCSLTGVTSKLLDRYKLFSTE